MNEGIAADKIGISSGSLSERERGRERERERERSEREGGNERE